MSQMSTEPVDITEIIAGFDQEIPCDWAGIENGFQHEHGPARWRVMRKRCSCGFGGTVRLICDPCKHYFFQEESAIRCTSCDRITAPARLILSSCDPL